MGVLSDLSGCRQEPQTEIQRLVKAEKQFQYCLFVFAWLYDHQRLLLLTPPYIMGKLWLLFQRMHPVFFWFLLQGFQFTIVLIFIRKELGLNPDQKNIFRVVNLLGFAIVLFVFLLIWLFISISGFGKQPDQFYWNEVGIPITTFQVICVLVAGAVGLWLTHIVRKFFQEQFSADSESKSWRLIDVFVFLLIWTLAIAFWVSTPAQDSPFSPGPYPPNDQIYPFSDAGYYDISAEFAMIGQGINNSLEVDKPIFSFLLFLLKLVTKKNFALYMNLYAGLMAIFPALLYLIGKNLQNRITGFAAAVLAIFLELSGIHSTTYINATHAKILMTEPLMRVGMALFVLFLIKTIRQKDKRIVYLILAGGIMGLTTMVRYNAWILFPLSLLVILLITWKNWKQAFLLGSFFCLTVLFSLSGWMSRMGQDVGVPFFFVNRFLYSIVDARYEKIDKPVYVEKTAVPFIEPVYTPTPEPSGYLSDIQLLTFCTTTLLSHNDVSLGSEADIQDFIQNNETHGFLWNVSNHFFHNIITSVLILPDSPVLDDLSTIIKQKRNYWEITWDIELNSWQTLALFLNLCLISIGVLFSWRKHKLAGIVPLLVYFTYNYGSALALTSGGRYLVPITWVVYYYYLAGVFLLLNTACEYFFKHKLVSENVNDAEDNSKLAGWQSIVATMVIFLVFSFFSAYLDKALPIPLRYPPQAKFELMQIFLENEETQNLSINQEEVITFLQNENSIVLNGRAMYPRFYFQGQGEPGYIYVTKEYPRIVFEMIGTQGTKGIILPFEVNPEYFPHQSDVLVVGCRNGLDIDALFVLVSDGDKQAFYHRSPDAPLTCPLPEPICDNNSVCK